jgi:voltage-gated potassium channel
VLVLLLIPLQLRYRALGAVLGMLYLNAVAVSVTAGRYPTRVRWMFFAGSLLMLALTIAPVAEPYAAMLCYVTSRVLAVGLMGGCVAAVLDYVLRSIEVSIDRIFAAIVAYLQAGLGFAAAYQAIVAVAPDSFALPAVVDGAGRLDFVEVQLVYFSFITLATLGYGDITPRLPLTQMLSVLEAVAGQFYVAVVVAWLVSVHAAQRRPGA